ncbi:MAG: hypothetical protein ACI9FN_001387 [Saprospiraceae bacterium]|jgi:hypothetical protein
MFDLLSSGGKLVGLLFDAPMYDSRPPYGGSKEAYLKLFSTEFENIIMEECYNSITPRVGTETFFIAVKS